MTLVNYNSFFSISSFYLTIVEAKSALQTFYETKDPLFILTVVTIAKVILNIFSYVYILVKFYKFLCYVKITCEWFPMLNPYVWPLSVIRIMTVPYFQFWSKLLPTLKFQKSSVEISGIIALEGLNAVIYFCVHIANELVIILKVLDR